MHELTSQAHMMSAHHEHIPLHELGMHALHSNQTLLHSEHASDLEHPPSSRRKRLHVRSVKRVPI
jgi:hypothetical protein